MLMTSNITAEARDVTETAFEGLSVGVVSLVAVVANVSLFAVVLTSRHLRNESNMLILSLSLADLLVSAVSMPLTTATIIFGTWTFNGSTCLTVGFLNMLTFTASVQSLAVISVNRYFKICRPSRFADIYTYQNVLGMCLGVWLVSGLVSMPPLLGWAAYSYLPNSYICFCEWRKSASYAFFMISFCFCLPCSAMTFCNIGILKAYVNSKKVVDSFAEKPQTSRLEDASAKRLHHGSNIVSALQKVPRIKTRKECQLSVSQKVKVIQEDKGTINKGHDNEKVLSTNVNSNAEIKKTNISSSDQTSNNLELRQDCLLFVHPRSANLGDNFDTLHNSCGSIHVEPKLIEAETFRRNECGGIIDANVKSEPVPLQLTPGEWNQTDLDYRMDHDQRKHFTTPEAPNGLMLKPKELVGKPSSNHTYSTTNSVIVISDSIDSDNQLDKVQHILKSDKGMHAETLKIKTSFQKHQRRKRQTHPEIYFYYLNRKLRRNAFEILQTAAKIKGCKGERRLSQIITSHRDQVTSFDQKSVTLTFRDSLKMKESKCTHTYSSDVFEYLSKNRFIQKVRKKRKIRSIKRGMFSLDNNYLKSLKDARQNEILCQLFKEGKTALNTNVYQRDKRTNEKWNRNRIASIQKKEIDSFPKHVSTVEQLDVNVCCHHTRLESIQKMDDYKNSFIAREEIKNETTSLASLNMTSGSAIPRDNVISESGNSFRPLEKEVKINKESSRDLNISSLERGSLVESSPLLLSQPQTEAMKMVEENLTSYLQPPFSIDTGKCLLSVPSIEKTMQESTPAKRYPLSTKSSMKSNNKLERRRMEEFQLAASLLVVILLFVVCWFPYCISMFVVVFSPEHSSKGLDLASLCFGYFNSCLNPIVYGVMNKKFKMAYRRMISSFLRPFRFQKNLNFTARASKKSRVEPVTLATVTST